MTRRVSLALLAGILAIPLCSTGSVPSSSHAVRKTLPAMGSRATPTRVGRIRICHSCPRSKPLPSTPGVRTSSDEPAVVILYGSRPWSWM